MRDKNDPQETLAWIFCHAKAYIVCMFSLYLYMVIILLYVAVFGVTFFCIYIIHICIYIFTQHALAVFGEK